jgi:hypothetical protein
MAPPSVKKEAEIKPVEAKTDDLWTCSKCGNPNPQLSISCFKCGAQLMRDCPECNEKRSLIKTGVCGNCGYKYEIATKRQQIRSLMGQEKDKIGAIDKEYSKLFATPIASSGCYNLLGFLLIVGGVIVGGVIGVAASGQDGNGVIIGLIVGVIGIVILVSVGNNSKKLGQNKDQKLRELNDRKEDIKKQITNLETELYRLQK